MHAVRAFLFVAATTCAAIGVAFAQSPGSNPSMPGMSSSSAVSEARDNAMPMRSQADQDMMDAMAKMDRGMSAARPTGNADRDFVAMMIPHHQGAIDMAEVELKYGKDPMLRRLAKNIVSAQQREIKEMREWQTRHPATH